MEILGRARSLPGPARCSKDQHPGLVSRPGPQGRQPHTRHQDEKRRHQHLVRPLIRDVHVQQVCVFRESRTRGSQRPLIYSSRCSQRTRKDRLARS